MRGNNLSTQSFVSSEDSLQKWKQNKSILWWGETNRNCHHRTALGGTLKKVFQGDSKKGKPETSWLKQERHKGWVSS